MSKEHYCLIKRRLTLLAAAALDQRSFLLPIFNNSLEVVRLPGGYSLNQLILYVLTISRIEVDPISELEATPQIFLVLLFSVILSKSP